MAHRRRFDWRRLGEALTPKNPLAVLNIFGSLRHRNFLLYFIGMTISMNGAWIQQVATGWLVYTMTNSVFSLSLSVFLTQIPTLFLMPFAGVVCDRFDRRKIIIFAQTGMMLQSFVLAALTLSGVITIPAVYALCFFQGVVISFDAPARQSFYALVVPQKDLSNAIALNSTAINATRFIGPAIGGVMIAKLGEGACFLTNAFSYSGILISMFLIRSKKTVSTFSFNRAFADVGEGMLYAFRVLPIRAVLILMVAVSFFAMPTTMLMPAFTKGVLGGDSEMLGDLMSFIGMGSLASALYLAARKSVLGLGRVVVCSSAVFGAAMMLMSFVRELWVLYILCFLVGFGMISVAASSNTMLQSLVDEEKRGRVMSIFSMAFFGIPPLGSIIQGYAAKYIPLSSVIGVCGFFCVVSAIVMEYYRPTVRSFARDIYARKGVIIPEIARGLQSSNNKDS